MSDTTKPFGQMLREKRIEKGFSLRKFAELSGVSPTYLSQVEQGKVVKPPTAERVKKMAELLDEIPDQWIALAGRVADEWSGIIKNEPKEIPNLLRAVDGLNAEQLRDLSERAKKMKNKGGE